MKKHIVCFGDSNTHGYCADPRDCADGGIRFNESERWPRRLQSLLGEEYLVIEEGLSGRTTCFDDPIHEGLSGLDYITPCLKSHETVDLLIVMLGGNDLLQGNCVEAVAQRMELFLGRIPLDKSKIVLIGPPRMKPGAWITDNRLLEECVRLNAAYREVAEKSGIRFVDATDWDIEVTFDGVHYSEQGHQTFAKNLYLALSQ